MARRIESRRLRSKAEVMEELGGLAGLSKLTNSGYKATENWTRAKTFPARFHALMTFELSKRGCSAPPSLWGQVTNPEMEKAAA